VVHLALVSTVSIERLSGDILHHHPDANELLSAG